LSLCDKQAELCNKENYDRNDDIERHRLRRLHICPPQISYKRKSLKRAGGWVRCLGREEEDEGRRKVSDWELRKRSFSEG
jgi:hypothetical protein